MDPRIAIALRAIHKGYDKPLTVGLMAQQVGLSTSRFGHLFAQETGSSFKSRLREIRLQKGKYFLGDCTLSIKQVGATVGYRYQPNFTRDFKNRFRKTPSEFRREFNPTRSC